MHPALHVDELVRSIVQHCDDLPYKEHQRTIFNLALTCKPLLEPALDSLWSRLPSVVPLMSLLPGLYVRDGKYTTERFLTTQEKLRFKRYANRVKDISQYTRFAVDEDISDILPFFAAGTSFLVLPNLSAASLAFSAASSNSCCLPVSPSMTQLRVRIDSSPETSAAADTLQQYLMTAQSIAQDLHSIKFRGKLSKDTNNLIASMSSLKSVSFSTGHSLTAQTFTSIGTFPILRTLSIRIDHLNLIDLPDSSDSLISASPIFPALEDLTVHAQASVMSYILSRLQPASLVSVSITIAGDMVSSSNHVQHPDWHDLLPLLAGTASPHLHTLRIDHPSSHLEHLNPLLPTDCLTYDLLRHFVNFRHLEELSLQLGLPVSLNDAEFALIAPAWPSLRCFRLETLSSFLDGEYDWTWVNPATPNALLYIAAHMPRLEELNIAVNATFKNQIPTRTVQPSTKLRYLHLASGPPCVEPDAFAKFIRAVFPALEDVDYEGCHEDAWQVINDTLQASR